MHCLNQIENTELLLAYAAGQLDAQSASALERHLAECESCRVLAAKQAELWQTLDLWEAPPLSQDFDRRLCARARDTRLAWWERILQPLGLPLRHAVTLAAAACLLLIAGLIVERPAVLAPARNSAEPVRVEQVERTLDDLDLLNQLSPASHPDKAHSDTL